MIRVLVEGMMCQNCVRHLKEAFLKEGIETEISLENSSVLITQKVNDEEIIKIVSDAGYEVVSISYE